MRCGEAFPIRGERPRRAWIACAFTILLAAVPLGGQEPRTREGGQLIDLCVAAPSLKANRFDIPAEQPASVYLPPSYRTSDRYYPVVYFLPGFGDPVAYYTSWRVFGGFSLLPSMDALIQSGKVKEMIVVIPNGNLFLGGSFFVNSPNAGNWEDFIVRDLVQQVDRSFRTLSSPGSRAIAGHSMGGFGALHLAMRHPEVFGACYALSPGLAAPGGLQTHPAFSDPRVIRQVRAIAGDVARARPAEARLRFVAWMSHLGSTADILPLFACAYGAAFAPSRKEVPPFVDLPFRGTEDKPELDPVIWKRYEDGFGNLEDKVARFSGVLRNLRVLVLDVGLQDEHTWIPRGCEHFSKLLQEKGIPHTLASFPGGHQDKLRERIERHMLPALSDGLVHETPSNSVPPPRSPD